MSRTTDVPRAMVGRPSAVLLPADPPGGPVGAGGAAPGSAWAAPDEPSFLRGLARECMEEVAGMRRVRAPGATDTRRDPARAEQHLLSALDGLLSCGRSALDRCVEEVLEGEVEDSDSWFAAAFALGCIDDASSLDALLRIARLADAKDPDAFDGVTEALVLAPHPGLPGAARAWLAESPPGLRALAIRILDARRELAASDVLGSLEDPDPRVAAAAATAFSVFPKRDLAVGVIRLLERPEEEVVRSALRTLLRHGHPQAPHRAAQLCASGKPEFADAAFTLAVFGARADGETLSALARTTASPRVIADVPWHGGVALVPALLERLEDEREEIRFAAAEALTRLLGEGPRVVPEPGGNRDAWRTWWSTEAGRFPERARFRRGRPFSPADVLDELDEGNGDRPHRERLALELALHAGDEAPSFRSIDFLPVQNESLAAWRAWLASRAGTLTPGAWRE